MWSNVNRLERLATWYSYSTAAVRRLISLYGVERGEAILKSLKKPGSRYFLRVNTLKASPREVVEILRGEGLEAYTFELLPDAVYMRVAGPFEVKLHRRVVVADKAAAESVYMGADLYAPGVLNARGVREGDRVSVVSPKGHLVAEGIAVMDGEEMVVRRRGLAVKVVRSVYRVPSVRRLIIYD
ncbi:MAG: 16S rRNA methyltransferase, partial [Thermoprotei archaeon]